MGPPAHPPDPPPGRFATTVWSVVLRAGRAGDAAAGPALADLCRAYWYPLYAYARRRGASPPEAEDLVQGFFAAAVEKHLFRHADPARGRFRGFLAAAFRRFCASRHEYESAAVRHPPGGLVPVETAGGEARYAREPADHLTPDCLFDYAWAVEVVGRAMIRLGAEQASAGRADRFDVLRPALAGEAPGTAADLGRALGMSEGAVRVAVHRLRQRYGELLREEVGATLEEGDDPDDELRGLLAALRLPRRA
jgi:RNA polymerase sigma-70 factor (ECF subfamily)